MNRSVRRGAWPGPGPGVLGRGAAGGRANDSRRGPWRANRPPHQDLLDVGGERRQLQQALQVPECRTRRHAALAAAPTDDQPRLPHRCRWRPPAPLMANQSLQVGGVHEQGVDGIHRVEDRSREGLWHPASCAQLRRPGVAAPPARLTRQVPVREWPCHAMPAFQSQTSRPCLGASRRDCHARGPRPYFP